MTGVEVNGCIGSTVMYVQLFLFKFLLNLRISHVSISLSTVFFLISLKHLVLLIYTPPFFPSNNSWKCNKNNEFDASIKANVDTSP